MGGATGWRGGGREGYLFGAFGRCRRGLGEVAGGRSFCCGGEGCSGWSGVLEPLWKSRDCRAGSEVM